MKEFEEKLFPEYQKFLTTKAGKEWVEHTKEIIPPGDEVDFGDYLYAFYPEYLM